jgi:iron complex outermembrane recepter protein
MSHPNYKPTFAALLAVLLAQNAHADSNKHYFNIPAQPLNQALLTFGKQSGQQLMYSTAVADHLRSRPVQGEFTASEAVNLLLAAAPLQAVPTREGTLTLRPKVMTEVANETVQQPTTLPTVKVKGNLEYDANDPYSTEYNRQTAATATKTDTPIMDTPVSIQVIPQQVLKDQQAVRVEDAVKNVSGVQPVWTSGGQGQDFVIRGFGSNYTRFRNGQRLSSFNTDLANVQQIEVLKGPAAMLYGRVQPGGMVNVVTKKPQAEAHYSIQQQFGSYDFYRTVAEATGPLIDDKSLTYRVDLGYTDRNSFRDFVSQNQFFIAPALHWQATEATEFNLNVEYMDRKLPYDTGIPAVGNRVANVPISTNYGQPGSKFNQDPSDSTLLDFNWSHAFNDNWKLQNGFVGNWANQHYREILVAVAQPLLTADNDPLTVRRGSEFEDFAETTYTTYLNLNGKFATGAVKHDVLLGADYYENDRRQSGFFGFNAAFAPPDSPYYFPNDFSGGNFSFTQVNLNHPVYPNLDFNAYENQRINHPNDFSINQTSWYGLYFQDQLAFFDGKLQILGGGRYDWARIASGVSNSVDTSYNDAGNYNGYVPSFSNIALNKQDEEFFSPRVGVLYRPWTWLSVYGNRVEGFGTNNGRSETGQPLKPETAEQYEAGFKTEWFDGRLTTNLAYFHINKSNVLTLVREGGIFDTIGAARSQGIEVDIAGQLTESLSLISSYAFTDARITNDGSAPDNNQGHRLPNVAEHSASTWLKYAFQQQALRGLNLGVGMYLAGEREGDNANSYQLPGYVRVDTSAGYAMDIGAAKLTTQLNVYNIFDKRYYVAGEPYNANRAWNMPGDPLTVMGLVKLEY